MPPCQSHVLSLLSADVNMRGQRGSTVDTSNCKSQDYSYFQVLFVLPMTCPARRGGGRHSEYWPRSKVWKRVFGWEAAGLARKCSHAAVDLALPGPPAWSSRRSRLGTDMEYLGNWTWWAASVGLSTAPFFLIRSLKSLNALTWFTWKINKNH